MTKKQIDKLNQTTDSTLQHSDSNNLTPCGLDSSLVALAQNDEKNTSDSRGSILDEKSGLRSHGQGNKTDSLLTKRVASLPDLSLKDEREQPKLRPIIKGANGLSLGISIVVAILLGIGAGVLMQKIFGVFWVLFLGVAWGIAAAILNVYKVYKAELRDFEKIANDPKYKNANP